MRSFLLLALFSIIVVGLLTATSPAQSTIPFKVVRTVPHTQSSGAGLAWMNETLWVANAFGPGIQQHDPYTKTMIKTITAPNAKVRGLTWDGSRLWMASWFTPPTASIFALDAATGKVLASYAAPFSSGHSNGMAWDGASLWISDEADMIHQCDPKKNLAIISSIPVPATGGLNPRDLAWDTGVNALWAGYQSAGVVRKHNPASGQVVEEFKSPYVSFQEGLCWDGWFLWATGGNTAKHMSQIDVHAPFVEMKGTPKSGDNIHFELSGATGQRGNLFVVGWSGSGTKGFLVGGKRIHLTLDGLTVLGLALLPFFSNNVDGGGTSITAAFPWPPLPSGLPFWVCGVTLDSMGVVSVNEPFKFISR